MKSKSEMNIPRGMRNNNPLNIRIGNVWLGEVQNPTDAEFEQFVHIKYGLRAAFVLLRRYINHYKRNTIPLIISSWAPNTENNTQAYIKAVVELSGISSDATIAFHDKVSMCRLVGAMAKVECGVSLSNRTLEDSYEIA